jgi:hypothetical protein
VVGEHPQAGAALAGDGLWVLGAQAQGDAAAAQRVGGRVEDRRMSRPAWNFDDGGPGESFRR